MEKNNNIDEQRVQSVLKAVDEVKKTAMVMKVVNKDIFEPQDLLNIMSMAMIEVIELYVKGDKAAAKELGKDVCEAITTSLEI